MPNEETVFEYACRQERAAYDYAVKSQESYGEFESHMQSLSADARNKVRELNERYLQQLQAAAGGDDAAERMSVAYFEYFRDYAKLSAEYFAASREQYQKLMESWRRLQYAASATALDGYIEFLSQLRDEPPKSAPSSDAKAKGNGPNRRKTA